MVADRGPEGEGGRGRHQVEQLRSGRQRREEKVSAAAAAAAFWVLMTPSLWANG